MSKLDDLINKLCPDGVDYKPLKDVSIMQRGASLTKANSREGEIPVISGGRVPAFYCDEFNRDGETITVAGSGAGAGYVQYWTIPIYANDCFTIKSQSFMITKYIFYFLNSIQQKIYDTKKGGGVPHVHISDIDTFEIPVPPLEIQNEIVQILDKYTSLETELEKNLEAELEARRKQYEYYRDSLLTFGDDVEWKPLGEVANIIDSLHQTPKYVGEGYGMIRVTDIKGGYVDVNTMQKVDENTYKTFTKRYKPKYNDIVISRVGSYGNFALIGNDPCCLGQNISLIEPLINSKYLYYYLKSTSVKNFVESNTKGAGHKAFGVKSILKIPIKVPSNSEQERIVSILDRFESLCNDITSGLPAEIEARHKQYEYYRDKLLTFKRKEA